jgi:hypothetical protein
VELICGTELAGSLMVKSMNMNKKQTKTNSDSRDSTCACWTLRCAAPGRDPGRLMQ